MSISKASSSSSSSATSVASEASAAAGDASVALKSAIAMGRSKDAVVASRLKKASFGVKVTTAKVGPPYKKAKTSDAHVGKGWLAAAPPPPPVLVALPVTPMKEVPSSFYASEAYLAMFGE